MSWSRSDFYPPLTKASEPADMRAAIEVQRMYNPIVRQALDIGRIRGMSAEDIYTMLAYHALQQLHEANRILLKLAETAPPVPVLVKLADLPAELAEKWGLSAKG